MNDRYTLNFTTYRQIYFLSKILRRGIPGYAAHEDPMSSSFLWSSNWYAASPKLKDSMKRRRYQFEIADLFVLCLLVVRGACLCWFCVFSFLFVLVPAGTMSQTTLLPLLAFYISYGIAGKMKECIVG